MRELFQRDPLDVGCKTAQPFLLAGNAAYEAGDFEVALGAYAQAETLLGQIPNSDQLYLTKAELLGLAADCHANLGAFDQALTLIDRAVESIRLLPDTTKHRHRGHLVLRDRRAFYLSWMGRCDAAAIESEAIISAQRLLAEGDPSCIADLARSLDHQAEILERAHRTGEAMQAAAESTELRRTLAQADVHYAVPFLRSLVTQARLAGALDDPAMAITLCEEGLSCLAEGSLLSPSDLETQFFACHGRNLMASGKHEEGESSLRRAAAGFRSLAREAGKPAIFMDAQAEVLLDLGQFHLDREPAIARRQFSRASILKRRLAEANKHPSHCVGHAEATIWLACANLATGHGNLECLNAAILTLHNLDYLPAAFPKTAVDISRFLIAKAGQQGLGETFWRLTGLLMKSIDIGDDDYLDEMEPVIEEFQQLWLKHFIVSEDAISLITWLSFAHGRRTAILALAERRNRSRTQTSPDEECLIDLRGRLYRLDLEMDEILSARNPSLIQREGPGKGGAGEAVTGAGAALASEREQLFREFVGLRDTLVARGAYPSPISFLQSPLDLLQALKNRGNTIAIWCVPTVFGVDCPPCLVLVVPDESKPRLVVVPDLHKTSELFLSLVAVLGAGRSGLRGADMPRSFNHIQPESIADTEAECWHQMENLWQHIGQPSQDNSLVRIDLVTHAHAHNLPWLGSCPQGIHLRQFPSLNFLIRRGDSPARPPPSPDRPLLLLRQAARKGDPFASLYHAELEAEIIRLAWPGAIDDVTAGGSSTLSDPTGFWIIGHGLTDLQGQPLIGVSGDQRCLANTQPMCNGNLPLGLVYASTCLLGHTSDTENEPVGLSSLAALRPDAPFAAGAIAPVDDLGATLLAWLFHHYWREEPNPRRAFDKARQSLASGDWPDAAVVLFKDACRRQLPGLLELARTHANISLAQVVRCYPHLSRARQLARQYAIRKQGLDSLECWEVKFAHPTADNRVDALLSNLTGSSSASPVAHRIKSTSKYWAWFG